MNFFFKSYNFCDQPTTFLQSTFSVPIGRLRHSRLLGIIYKEYLNHGYVSVLPLMVPQTRAEVMRWQLRSRLFLSAKNLLWTYLKARSSPTGTKSSTSKCTLRTFFFEIALPPFFNRPPMTQFGARFSPLPASPSLPLPFLQLRHRHWLFYSLVSTTWILNLSYSAVSMPMGECFYVYLI